MTFINKQYKNNNNSNNNGNGNHSHDNDNVGRRRLQLLANLGRSVMKTLNGLGKTSLSHTE